MRRHGWSCQVPVRQALERDEDAVAVWKAEVWPEIKEWRATWAPTSASRTRQARAEAVEGPHLGAARREGRRACARRRRRAGQHRRGGVLPAQGPPPVPVYKLLVYRRRKGEAKGFTWADYRDLILAAHRELSAPLVWI